MKEEPESEGTSQEFTALELAMIGAYLPELRHSLKDQRILRSTLTIGLLLGLVSYVAGYLLRAAAPPEPLRLLADLLYGFGLALWTGVVVAFFAQVIPEAKRQQVERAIKDYEASKR